MATGASVVFVIVIFFVDSILMSLSGMILMGQNQREGFTTSWFLSVPLAWLFGFAFGFGLPGLCMDMDWDHLEVIICIDVFPDFPLGEGQISKL
jgi:hypothetical protein